MACGNDYVLITDEDKCNEAATYLVAANPEVSGWATVSNTHSVFIPGNPYTAGCFWNNRGTSLMFNQYGIEGQCTGHQDCRTLCVKQGIFH